MAGLFNVRYNNAIKDISINQLDQFMDYVAQQQSGNINAQALLKIALSFRALDIIAGAVSRMPYTIYRGETDVTEEATPHYWADLQYRLCESYLLFNAAYCLLETNQFGANANWRFLVSPQMTYQLDPKTKQLSGFKYDNQNIENYEKRLLWWWWPNILAEVGPGSGPTNAAIADAALIKYLTDFATSYFQRGGFPVTLLQMSGPISPDEQTKLESWWNSMIAGVKRAFRAVLISNKIVPTQIGSNIKDTIAPELYDQSARNVAIAYGIPISIMMSDAANYATSLEDHVKFYTETVIPIANRMIEVWNERVFEPQGLMMELEPEQLEIMQQYELQKAQSISALVGGPIMTRAEGRALMGYEEEVAETPAPAPTAAPVDEAQQAEAIATESEKRLATERANLKRKAHNCLRDGKPFKFVSDLIPAHEIERVRACKTHEEIEAVEFSKRDVGLDVLEQLQAAIAQAKAMQS